MLPSKNDPRWTALLTGKIDYKFSNAAASMLMFRLKTKVKSDSANLATYLNEMHAFFTKYEGILKEDITIIFK